MDNVTQLPQIASPEQLAREALTKAIKPFSSIEVESISWMWHGFLQAERLGLLIGDGGIGKGLVTAYIFARLSTGDLPGSFKGKPTKTLFVSSEEHYASETLPRLMAQEADLNMVSCVDPQEFALTLTEQGSEALCGAMADQGIGIVHLDPIVDFCPPDLQDNNDVSVRAVLKPLGLYAQQYGVTPVGLRHVKKGRSEDFSDITMGAKAWRNAARSAVGIFWHPEEDGKRVAINIKANNAAGNQGDVFTVEGVEIPGVRGQVPKLVWTEEVYSFRDLQELNGMNSKEKDAHTSAKGKRHIEIEQYFKAQGGEVKAKEAKKELLRRLGVSWPTLDRDLRALGVVRGAQGDSEAVWAMPVELDSPKTLLDTL